MSAFIDSRDPEFNEACAEFDRLLLEGYPTRVAYVKAFRVPENSNARPGAVLDPSPAAQEEGRLDHA